MFCQQICEFFNATRNCFLLIIALGGRGSFFLRWVYTFIYKHRSLEILDTKYVCIVKKRMKIWRKIWSIAKKSQKCYALTQVDSCQASVLLPVLDWSKSRVDHLQHRHYEAHGKTFITKPIDDIFVCHPCPPKDSRFPLAGAYCSIYFWSGFYVAQGLQSGQSCFMFSCFLVDFGPVST